MDIETAVVDFMAAWCGPCRNIKPLFKELREEYDVEGRIVDVEEHTDFAKEHNIKTVPTFIAFRDGVPVEKKQSEEDLRALFDQLEET